MYDHEIRWLTLIPVSILMGFGVLFAETFGLWSALPIRPDWFWCLAFFAALRAPSSSSMLVFAWCGLARDFLLGPKPGAAAIAFILAGWITLFWKPLASLRGWPAQAVMSGAAAFFVSSLKHGLDAGQLASVMWERIFLVAAGDAVLTGLFYIPLALIFSIPSFRPWRERYGYY